MREGSVKKPEIAGFPQAFQKTLFSDVDKHFFLILVCCLFVESLIVFILSRQPVAEFSQREIAQIQERFAQFVLEEDKIDTVQQSDAGISESGGGEAAPEESAAGRNDGNNDGGGGDPGEEGGVESASARHANRMADASQRRAVMTQQVSNKGLLGLLSASGGNAAGASVTDVLGSAGQNAGSDLDDVLAASDGLKSTGSSGLSGTGTGNGTSGARGGRSGQKATTIDDLVTNKTTTSSQSINRSGEVQVETPADLAGRGHGSIYRSGQELQRVIYDHYSAIKYCYERELKRHPTLKGKVTVRITVHPDGHVENVEIVNSSLNNERVERCILTRIRRWKDFKPIDQNEGSVSFTQAFNFGY